jgi:hypothetical protein
MQTITYEGTELTVVWRGDFWRLDPPPVIATPDLEPARLVVPRGMKPCITCRQAKKFSEFPKKRNTCRACRTEYWKLWKRTAREAALPLVDLALEADE